MLRCEADCILPIVDTPIGTQRRSHPISQYNGLRFRAQLDGAGRASAHFAGPPVSVRERQVDALNLHHRQLIEATLICLEAIG
jgi:hypothetical protein